MPPSRDRRPSSRPNGSGTDKDGAGVGGVEGLFTGLSGLLKTLADLAEKGQDLQREGGFTTPSGKPVNFHYGVSVRTAGEGGGVRVEPFGNLKTDKKTGDTRVQEVREPITDVFEESDHVKVVLEMPGVQAADVKATLEGDILTVSAERSGKKYRKETLLPGGGSFDASKLSVSCNSGVVEIRVPR